MKQEQPIITYRKNGQEITKTITKWNETKVLKDIFKFGNKLNEDKYELYSEIEYIHLKNVSFLNNDVIDFWSHNNQIVILEDCIFHGHIQFIQGNFQIIRPIFKRRRIRIRSDFCNILDVILNQENIYEDNHNIEISFKVENINHFSLSGSKHLKEIMIYANNIQLDNINNVEILSIMASKKITFGKNNHIILHSSRYHFIEAQEINLGSTIIKNLDYPTSSILINAPYITGKDFILMSIGNIEINYNNYCKTEYPKYLILTQHDFAEISILEPKRKLISCLKAINNEVEKRYEERVTQAKTKLLKKFNNQPIGKEKF